MITDYLQNEFIIKLQADQPMRSFAYGGPRLWNNFDIKLRTIVSPETFKRELKTHLYKSVYTC